MGESSGDQRERAGESSGDQRERAGESSGDQREPAGESAPFVHTIRPRYAEVDMQGVVFNAHWLTYFDDACTRWFEWLGLDPSVAFFSTFDVMLVKAVLEWQGPARFDQPVDVAVAPTRLGTASFDLTYTATTGGAPACVGVITYVSVEPGTHDPKPVPDEMRALLTP